MSAVPVAAWFALLILAPLAAAALGLAGGARLMRALVVLVTAVLAVSGTGLAHAVYTLGPLHQRLGGWGAPLGIELSADGLSAAMVLMTAAVGTAVSLYAGSYFRLPGQEHERRHFWPLWFLLWAALNALFLSADIFNLYVTLELLSIAAVALVTLSGATPALAAGLRYLIAALLGSMGYLLGVALLYGAHATLELQALRNLLVPGPVAWTAASLITVGLLLKTAVFPLHFWLPPAHGNAHPPVSALLSALVIKGSFYMLLRLWYDAFAGVVTADAAQALGALGAAALLWGSVLALRAAELKLLVAYSTVAQIGYLMLVFPLAGKAGAEAWNGGIYHILSHAVAKAAMFLSAGSIIRAAGSGEIARLQGIARSLPIPVFAFALAGMSLMGLPPSGGFIAKWLLLQAAISTGQWWWVAVLIAGTLLSAGYVFRVLRGALATAHEPVPLWPVAPLLHIVPLVLALGAVALGLYAGPPLALLKIGAP